MTRIKQYTVQADTETGQWIDGTLKYIKMVDSKDWLQQTDTDEKHFDTFEPSTESETCAIEVHWI